MDWPEHLVERIAENGWVLFIGSGVSATCVNSTGASPPAWAGLLTQLCNLVGDSESRDVGLGLIEARDYLSAADHVLHCVRAEGSINSYHRTIQRAVEGPPGDPYQPSVWYEHLLALNPRIVFTTNYDKLFEMASRNAYATHRPGSRTLSANLRRGDYVLVKLHGSTDSIQEIVLTRTDFARLMSTRDDVLEALRALSLTSTILFIGYSLDDPDIQFVFQAVGRGSLDPEAHFMLAPEPATLSRIPVFATAFGVTVLTYPTGEHETAEAALSQLAAEVLGRRTAGVASS